MGRLLEKRLCPTQNHTRKKSSGERGLRKTWACLIPCANSLSKKTSQELDVVVRIAKMALRGKSAHKHAQVGCKERTASRK